MRNQEADNVAKKLIENFITIFGVPMQIHTDQGTNFESNLFKALCKYLDIDKTRTTVMRPQSDGMAERYMRTIEDMSVKTDPLGLRGRQVSVRRCSDDLNRSLKSFIE